MKALLAVPGETIIGVGIDFVNHLDPGETVTSVTVSPATGIEALTTNGFQTYAVAVIRLGDTIAHGDYAVEYTAAGSLGSVRKGTRIIRVTGG